MMIVTTPPSKGLKSRKRKREMEELSSPSLDAVSETNLRETAPMILVCDGIQQPTRVAPNQGG